jgi:hypothetical protein
LCKKNRVGDTVKLSKFAAGALASEWLGSGYLIIHQFYDLLEIEPTQPTSAEELAKQELTLPGCLASGIEQDGDIVSSEGAFAYDGASSYHSLVILARCESSLELARDFVETGSGVAHNIPRPAGADIASAHAAGLTSIPSSFIDLHSGLRNDAGDTAFLLGNRERFDSVGKIFDSVELMIAGYDGDSDRIDLWI